MDETPIEERVFSFLQDSDAVNTRSSWYYNSDTPVMYQDLAQNIAQSTPKKHGRDTKKKPKNEEQIKYCNKTWTETIKGMDIPVGFREVHMVSPPQTRNGKKSHKSSKNNKTADPSIENGPVIYKTRNTYLVEEKQMSDRAPATDVISGQQNIVPVPPKAINVDASPSTAADRVKAARARRYKRVEQAQNINVSVQDTNEPQPRPPTAPRVETQTTRAPQVEPQQTRADCYLPQPPAASPVQPQPRIAHRYKPGSSKARCVQPQPPPTPCVHAQPPTAPHVEPQPPRTSRVQPQPPKAPRVHTQPPTAVSEKPHPPTALSVMSQLTTELSMLPTAPHVYLQPPTAMNVRSHPTYLTVQPPGKHGSYPRIQ